MKMKTLLVAIAIASLGCAGTTSDHRSDESAETGVTGTLSLKLTSFDSDGRAYRLRNATFHVQGYWSSFPFPSSDASIPNNSTTLSSETNPDAPLLSVKLTPGYYDVSLGDGAWYLERRTNGVWQRVEQVVLLSPPVQGAYIVDGGVSTVNYRFGVDGQPIDFRSGDLLIGVSIEQPGEGDGGVTGGLTGGYGGITGGGWSVDAGGWAQPSLPQ